VESAESADFHQSSQGTPLLKATRFPYAVAMPNPSRGISLIALRNQVRPSGRLWNPAADVYRAAEGWIIKVDLAGISADDLEIMLEDSYLLIRGCRRDTSYREGFTCQQMEITYSRFEKRLQFPCSVDGGSVTYDYRDGFLIINLRCK
jgi:HSP20 family protein